MTTSKADISFVLSGGSGNLDPNQSLGGNPSASPVTDSSLNNLFDDVAADETEDGHEDYRCIYIFNDGDTTIFNVKVWIYDDFDEGSFLEMGIEQRDEVQRITISGDVVTSGSVTFAYGTQQFVSNYNSDLGVWATELEDSLNSLAESGFSLLKDVAVTAQNAGSDVIVFDVSFVNRDGKRNHSTLSVVSNSLSPTVSVAVSTPQQGSPINTIAATINVETTPPGGVGFFVPTEQSPITLPYLKVNEGFPIWIKRYTEPSTVAVADDGFTLRFSAESLDPNP